MGMLAYLIDTYYLPGKFQLTVAYWRVEALPSHPLELPFPIL